MDQAEQRDAPANLVLRVWQTLYCLIRGACSDGSILQSVCSGSDELSGKALGLR